MTLAGPHSLPRDLVDAAPGFDLTPFGHSIYFTHTSTRYECAPSGAL